MRKTKFPDNVVYKSTFGSTYIQTKYGRISSYRDGDWHHTSINKQGLGIGEYIFNGGHYYRIRL